MKKTVYLMIFIAALGGWLSAQSEAGAIWLLINPGARAAGMGEVGAAIANDAYSSYYNCAGLGLLKGQEVAMAHTNWLPNLASDIYYDFIGYRRFVPTIGTLGGHLILMNLGEQIAMSERAEYLGEFYSYMLAATLSYGTAFDRNTAIGVSIKMIHQHLTDILAGAEKGKGYSTDFAFDVGYIKRNLLLKNLTFGASMANIGPKIAFIDVAQADPMPTNLKLGMAYIVEGEYNRLTIAYDINKLLVASYPDRDIDGDGKVGGYDKNGRRWTAGDFNKKGQRETAYSDEWYLGLFTSWIDDWLLLYDSAADGIGDKDKDGNTKDGSLRREFEKLNHNFGLEYWYSDLFAIRFGFIYDKTGKILLKGKYPVPTFGAGLRYAGLGFDFGYTAGDPGHPRQNTMLFSLNMNF